MCPYSASLARQWIHALHRSEELPAEIYTCLTMASFLLVAGRRGRRSFRRFPLPVPSAVGNLDVIPRALAVFVRCAVFCAVRDSTGDTVDTSVEAFGIISKFFHVNVDSRSLLDTFLRASGIYSHLLVSVRPRSAGLFVLWGDGLRKLFRYSVQLHDLTADTCTCVSVRRLFERNFLVYVKVDLGSEVVSCVVRCLRLQHRCAHSSVCCEAGLGVLAASCVARTTGLWLLQFSTSGFLGMRELRAHAGC